MIGKHLGNWIIDKELGHGGMGRVYLAHQDAPNGRQAAVKVLAPELALDTDFLSRFQREIAVLNKLDHPNIVRLFESGAQDGHYFYAMEYVEGHTFNDLLQEKGRLPWPEVLDLALQICPALKHAHDHGVIHRDVKPSNLLRTLTGVVKLTDFGIAHVFAGTRHTKTGGVVGTAEYLSPEQAEGKPAGKRSDLYSLGVVLYTLLTGRTPFQGTSIPDLLHKHRFGRFDRPQLRVPELPYEIDDAVCQLLEKDPGRRPPDARVLQRQLESIRRKLERKGDRTFAGAKLDHTFAENEPVAHGNAVGPATLMSQLVRQELDNQNRGGALRQLLNRTWVLVVSLVLCVGLLVWALWPASAESLYQRGAALMASEDPDDWYKAWRDYLGPLNRKYPDHPYQLQVEQFRQKLDKARKARAPTLKEWEQWYNTREDIPEPVREFIAREVLKVDYKPLTEIKKDRD